MRENGGLVVAFIFGLIVISISFGVGLSTLRNPEPERYPTYYQSPGEEQVANRLPLEIAKSPEIKQPCNDPKNREESDLCAQWVAANAARSNAVWAENQYWVSIFTLVGLSLTVIFTLHNAYTAECQLAHARDVSSLQYRAWIHVNRFKLKMLESGDWVVTARASNQGLLTAHNVRFVLETAYFDHPLPRHRMGTGQNASPFVTVRAGGKINAQMDTELSQEEITKICAVEAYFWVKSTITYRPAIDLPEEHEIIERVFTQADFAEGERPRLIEEWMHQPRSPEGQTGGEEA